MLYYYSVEFVANFLTYFEELFLFVHENKCVVGIVGAGTELKSVSFQFAVYLFLFKSEYGFFEILAQVGFERGYKYFFLFPVGADVVGVEHKGKGGIAQHGVGRHGKEIGIG